MDFLEVRLDAPAASLPALEDFYAERLGLGRGAIGATRLEFRPSAGQPFYHFALLAPGNRFDPALEWLTARVDLLPERESGEVVFDFSSWEARACYFHDPAGNIVELIAHRGVGESAAEGVFSADELLGFSELGIVGDTPAITRKLEGAGLLLWDGTVSEGRLGFVGEKARTLIVCPEGRPWVPTGRPAEAHPLEVVVTGVRRGD